MAHKTSDIKEDFGFGRGKSEPTLVQVAWPGIFLQIFCVFA